MPKVDYDNLRVRIFSPSLYGLSYLGIQLN